MSTPLIVLGYIAAGLFVARITRNTWAPHNDAVAVFLLTAIWPFVVAAHIGGGLMELGEWITRPDFRLGYWPGVLISVVAWAAVIAAIVSVIR